MEKLLRKPVRIFGITFAPLLLPLERRLQTFAMIYLAFMYFFCAFVSYWLLWRLLWSSFWYLGAAYIAWIFYDNKFPSKEGRLRSDRARNFAIYRWARDYFPVELHKTSDFDTGRSYLCGYHPHGVMPNGAVLALGSNACGVDEKFTGFRVTLLALGAIFWIPIYREALLMLGQRNVYRETMSALLSEPANIVSIVVGGAAESLEGNPGRYTLILRKRKGFVREAIKHGADLVPVFGFGETNSYNLVHAKGGFGRWLQEITKRYTGVTIPFFCGRGIFQYSFGVLPFRRRIDVVVGAPVSVEKNPNPTTEEIDDIHAKYVQALTDLFETHKPRFEPDATLEIK